MRAREDGRGFLVITNEFGHAARFEVAAWVQRETFELVELVGMLTAFLLESPAGWKAGDTVAAQIEELRIGGFVIAEAWLARNPPTQAACDAFVAATD